ncbi:putative MFS transporter [Aspergillus brunneoviolaceus CBS 621.78]|uniref:MFS general substrate transporter n=1 Tax=Aspergillus brunneoviolaceus CBS 621.78 TaxID=1450534 RepID=A0ACD1GDE6_9EURO|nr:MFS general substrate transporter [Aspergillus brunneoviolaceus CBS 621.78]RAH47325.1 MFS general substrate transporter [Aspergillus brunneoviolaceus CBS 621.78]
MIPRPSIFNGGCDGNEQRNPRNWRPWKKRLLFFALMSSSILADGGMTWGATLIDISVDKSATTMNYGMLLQGVGGLMANPLIEAYGRVFTTFRSLQGLFGTAPQVVGLPIIHDMYPPEDAAGTTFLVGPFLGPALAGYIGAGSNWKVSFGILTVFYGLSTLLVFVFGHETYYVPGRQYQRNSRLLSMVGVKNHNLPAGPTLLYWCKTMVIYIFKLPLLLTGIATMINFCWPIGITVTVSTFVAEPPYLFNTAAILGALLGWVYGYWFNGWVSRSSPTTYYTEKRLHGVWAAIITIACGLLTYGLTLSYIAGMVANLRSITAYELEKYPEQSTVVSAIINTWRTASGFSVGYFQPAWIQRDGIAAVFGTQAAVVVANIILTITPVIVMRRREIAPKVTLA